MIFIAVITVTAALVFYTIAAWSELLSKELKKINVIFYWMGLVCDLSATLLMSLISKGLSIDFHSLIGISALLLMLIKTIYSNKLWIQKNISKTVTYKIITFIIWGVWVIVFVNGAVIH